jgi:translation initiation factor 4A
MNSNNDNDNINTGIEDILDPLVHKWDEMDLSPEVLRGIYAFGFEEPSEIQKKAIVPMIAGRDILAQAQSGSGKTGTFAIGTLNQVDTSKSYTQGLILAPTHELAKQIANVVSSIGDSMNPPLRVRVVIGGTSIRTDISEIEENVPHIIVGCVGRVYDMVLKRHIDLSKLKVLVLDEADEMLSQGFGSQIQDIFRSHLSKKTQIALFSATVPTDMIILTKKILQNPVHIRMKTEDLTLKAIQQYYVALPNDETKYATLKDIFSAISVNKCIIYCNSIRRVETLAHSMERDGFSVKCIHSNMEKSERQSIMESFRNADTRVLISSDITARGIDVQQVSVVVNFDITSNVNTYLHRIGRSGRWGRKGFAINLVTQRDIQYMRDIEKHYSITIDELPKNFMCTV